MRQAFRATPVVTLFLVCIALIVPSIVAGNIRVEPRLEDPVTGIMILIVTNFPIDLLLISVAVSGALAVTGRGLGKVSEDAHEFVLLVIIAAALVAVAGGVIDFAFLYERSEDHYILKDLTAGVLLPAIGTIFATIAIFVYAVIGIRPAVSLTMAACLAPLSAVSWWFSNRALGFSTLLCSTLVVVLSAVFAFGVLAFLSRLHRRQFSGEGDKAYEGV